jgi:hypothetical protein
MGGKGGSALRGENWTTPTALERSGQGERNRALVLDVKNWATPTTNEHTGAGCGPNKDGAPNLRTQVDKWATPDCKTSTYSNGLKGPNLREQTAAWPTPNAHVIEHKSRPPIVDGTRKPSDPQISTADYAVHVFSQWPTPSASVANDGESPQTWHARAAKLKEKHGNGNGAGLPLTVAATQWPTPAARDSKGANSEEHCTVTGGGRKHMDQLSNFVAHSSHQAQQTPDGAESSPNGQGTPRRLNPIFGEWLMGWPSQWSKAEPSASSALETELFRSKLASHLSSLLDEQALAADWKEAA